MESDKSMDGTLIHQLQAVICCGDGDGEEAAEDPQKQ